MPSKTISHLRPELYANPNIPVRVTINLKKRASVLTGDVAKNACELLSGYFKKESITNHACVVLPSSVKFIISPTSSKNIFVIVDEVRTQLERRVLPKEASFYPDFFDHILRKSEDPKALGEEFIREASALGLDDPYPYFFSSVATSPRYEVVSA